MIDENAIPTLPIVLIPDSTSKPQPTSTEDAEEPTESITLPDGAIHILRIISRDSTSQDGLTAEQISVTMETEYGKTQYLLDVLEDYAFVSYTTFNSGDYYFLTKTGRKYLYETLGF